MKEEPIASYVISMLKKSNKRMFITNLILIILVMLLTGYTLLLLDSMNRNIGFIRDEVTECE